MRVPGWKLARLRAMSASEIAHRARVALRDRLAPPSYTRWTPIEAFGRLYAADAQSVLRSSRLGALGHVVEARELNAEMAAARALMEGRWMLFGREVRLSDPPRWNANPSTGAAWPDSPSARIDYHDTGSAGDPKQTWELGRLTVLPTLALAARLSGERAFADRAIRWLDDFTARNPLGHGIHHTAGIEDAVRVITLSWTLALLGERAHDVALDRCLGLMAQQALHCRDHLSVGSSANNHLIAEYAALATLGALFPALRGADALRDQGLRGIEREALRQFDADGVSLEQSFGYVPFIWELMLTPLIACSAAGSSISPPLRARLRASLEFARLVRLPDGRWPRIGDEDDARVLLAGSDESRLDLVGNALAAWLEEDGIADGAGALAALMTGAAPRAGETRRVDAAPRAGGSSRPDAPARTREAADGVRLTRDYTVWRERGLLVTFDHGALGLSPLAAHGHADALAITAHVGSVALIVDPGTFSYHADRAARDRCRSTPVHATLHFGGRSQARMRGPFLWDGLPVVRAAEEPVSAEGAGAGGAAGKIANEIWWECRWTSGEIHRRRVAVEAGEIVIEDRIMRGSGAEISFPLAPGAHVELDGTRARVTFGGASAVFEGEGLEPWRMESAEVAPRYGTRVSAPRLAAALTAAACKTTIRAMRG